MAGHKKHHQNNTMTYVTDANTADVSAETDAARKAQIRELNDTLRTTGLGGQTFLTDNLCRGGCGFVDKACKAVREFRKFNRNNDPYEEHDCATLKVEGKTVIFKVSYYDLDMRFLSSDPSDPKVTKRVLTIMLAEDW